eukprot:601199-Alexandrium_andersonii.AAC.1
MLNVQQFELRPLVIWRQRMQSCDVLCQKLPAILPESALTYTGWFRAASKLHNAALNSSC